MITLNFEKKPLNRGTWSAEEDQRLMSYINRYGIWNWNEMPKAAGLSRTGKSCRLRWMNYLRPDIRRGNFSSEEDEIILNLHGLLGNRWSAIASNLPGRTDNDIKNYWHTHLKKRNALQEPKTEEEKLEAELNEESKSENDNDDTGFSFFSSPNSEDSNENNVSISDSSAANSSSIISSDPDNLYNEFNGNSEYLQEQPPFSVEELEMWVDEECCFNDQYVSPGGNNSSSDYLYQEDDIISSSSESSKGQIFQDSPMDVSYTRENHQMWVEVTADNDILDYLSPWPDCDQTFKQTIGLSKLSEETPNSNHYQMTHQNYGYGFLN